MSHYQRNKEFYGQPFRLSEEQKKDPLQVFDDFFSAFFLHECRECLAEWLECALVSDNDQFSEPGQRGSIVSFAERLEELLEAAYILTSKKKMA